MPISNAQLKRFIVLMKRSSYNPDTKNSFRKLGIKILKELASILKLTPDEYDIRWNPGGIAVSGDIILHANHFYLCISDFGDWFYYRTCKNKMDYSGGCNVVYQHKLLVDNGLDVLARSIEYRCPKHVAEKI